MIKFSFNPMSEPPNMKASSTASVLFILSVMLPMNSVQAENVPVRIKYQGKYYVDEPVNGYHRITTQSKKPKTGLVSVEGDLIIKPKFQELSHAFSCGLALAQDVKITTKDGIKNWDRSKPRIIDIKTGKVVEPLNHAMPDVFSGGDKRFVDVIRIGALNEKKGLYNACTGDLLEPQFKTISQFNENGLAVAFAENDYTVINAHGQEVLDQRFPNEEGKHVHGLDVQNNNIIGTVVQGEGDHRFGVFDLQSKSFIVDATYDHIKVLKEFGDQDGHYMAVRGDEIDLLDSQTGQNLLPQPFHKHGSSGIRITEIFGQRYIEGPQLTGVDSSNDQGDIRVRKRYFSLKDRAYLLPDDVQVSFLSPVEQLRGNHQYLKVSIVDPNAPVNDRTADGIYDLTENQFVLKPDNNQAYQSIALMPNDRFFLMTTKGGDSAVMDLNANFVTPFQKNVSKSDVLHLTKDGVEVPFIVLQTIEKKKMTKGSRTWNRTFHTVHVYGSDGQLIVDAFQDNIRDLRVKVVDDLVVVKEIMPTQPGQKRRSGTTCINSDHQIVGERFQCKA